MGKKYIYWGYSDPPHGAWHLIGDTEEERAKAIQEGATAFTTMSFSFPPEEGKPEPTRFGDLILDFDSKNDPKAAIMGLIYFIEWLINEYDANPYFLQYWISGGKGCHLLIPARMFGGEEGDPLLPCIHEKMVHEINEGGHMPLSRCIDMSMYPMGKGKLLRIENIRRRNGRYKIPVLWDELTKMPMDDLLALTAHSRQVELADPRTSVPKSESLTELFLRCQVAVHAGSRSRTQTRGVEAVEKECAFIRHCRDDAATLSEPEWYAMITNFAVLGPVGRELIHSCSRIYPSYSVEETNKKIRHALEGSPMTCTAIKKIWDCGKNCGVSSPYLLYRAMPKSNRMDGIFALEDDGLYFRSDPNDLSQKGLWLSSSIEVVAQTRDPLNGSWGRLVRFHDANGVLHQLILSMAELGGNGDSVRQMLLEQGLRISPDKTARSLLIRFLNDSAPQMFARVVKKFGWIGDVYVLRNIAYGGAEGELFIPDAPQLSDIFEPSGTLEDWRKNVANPCLGNPLLELAIAFAFTGPLLEPCGLEGGGLHFFGPSSCGKTTVLKVTGSVCGGGGKHGYIRQWRATDNALEGTAATHCDNLLCLDEIGQASSRVVSEVAYMLANGQGKARANKEGNTKAIQEWRLSFMSTGELTLADKIAEDGRGQVMAGQAVRVLDIPADGGTGQGIFTCIPDGLDGDIFSQQLVRATGQFYGTPLRGFLERLVDRLDEHVSGVEKKIADFVRKECPEGASGQVKRACQRFGLIAAAGEKAISFGVLPWPEGTASRAAQFGFSAWIKERGGIGDMEIENALERIKTFFQKHAETRFRKLDSCGQMGYAPLNPAGYVWEEDNGERIFLVEPNVFRDELCRGVNRQILREKLKELKWLARNRHGMLMETKWIGGRNKRGICFVPQRWEESEPGLLSVTRG
ncbi:DUF927 domain-containing protein [Bilophila wadsworthia]|uniref:DUF927 domain-containing protein n=2 Tax=Bilophila wadsworthia TaxID=35833 RepID=UPI00242FF29E|nr:DUF927 domain-containing protein [Bilophila wadsworthia]